MTLKPTGVSNRVLDKGLQEARTDNPRKAANTWVDEIKRNPYSLAGQLKDLLPKQYSTVKAEELYVKKGNKIMPSDKAKEAVHDLYAFMERARISKASAAEVKGYNTGLVDGQIVRSNSPVIVGDKTAIKLQVTVGKNKGKTYYILARCGNLVLPEKTPTPIPVGKTDQPEPEYQNFQATKEWKNIPEGTIVPAVTFQLVRDDKVIVSTKVLQSGQTSISFGRHITKTVDGRRHTYTVQEIVPDGYEMSRNGNHFVNTYKTPKPVPKPKEQFMSITVNKRWVNGLDKNPPNSVKVNLLQDGKVYDHVRLNDNNSWQHTFSKLPVYNNKGGRHRYEVKEVDVPSNYSPSYQIMTGGFIIINTYHPPKTPPPPILTPKSNNPGDYKYPVKKPGNNQVNPSQAENTPPRGLRNEEKAKPASKEKLTIEKEEVKEYKEGRTAEERHEMAIKEKIGRAHV